MKFSHISDTHLGQIRSKKARMQDTDDAFREAIGKSIEEKVDFVIFSGDIFDKSRPPNDAVLLVMEQLMLLKKNGIQPYFVLGQHDSPKTEQNAILWLYSMTGVAHYLGDGKPVKFKDVLLIGSDHRDEGNDLDELLEKFKVFDSVAKEHDGHKILVLHQGLNDVHDFAGELNVDDLPKKFTYYAIGDIHKNFEKRYPSLGGPLVYPGSIEISSTEGIKETSKGFYIVDISSEEAIPKWIELDLRPRFEMEVDVNDLHEKVEDLISKINPLRRPLVKLTVLNVKEINDIRIDIERLQEHVLELSYDIKTDDEQYRLVMDDSGNIDDDFKRLATENVGPELAKLAFEKLYPLLNEDKHEIKEIIINYFEDFKARNKK